jgi:GT2 family glycosyltransferase
MAKKISVIIPNYNGKELLAKNLPTVVKNCPDCETILVDDNSTDDSVKFVKKNFKSVKIIENKKNKGFALSVNSGVLASKAQFIILLNSDVVPQKAFLKHAVAVIEKKNDLFAVGFADYSHENGGVATRGRGGAMFTRGLFNHFAANPKYGETLWVSGGSGIFDRRKFLELSGFDSIYSPFYWEDIDLSYRAWKKGFRSIFQPKSKVDHYHEEGAIKKQERLFLLRLFHTEISSFSSGRIFPMWLYAPSIFFGYPTIYLWRFFGQILPF